MKPRAVKDKGGENPRVKVAEQLLREARLHRRNGTPEEAKAASEWEILIERTIHKGGELPKAA